MGVDGLWRWAFNQGLDTDNNLYDRFWDNMILWMLSGSDNIPSKAYSFRAGSANIALGESVSLRLGVRVPDPDFREQKVSLSQNGQALEEILLSAGGQNGSSRLTGEFKPESVGRYMAQVTLPDGSLQEVRFIVYDDNREKTEVAVDREYLSALCEASGGRLLAPDELAELPKTLQSERGESKPKMRLSSLWDRVWIFYLIGLCFTMDWVLRRKWGLA